MYLNVSSQNLGGNRKALEGAKRPTAGDEPREFSSRGEGGRVPPFIEKLHLNQGNGSGLTPFSRKSFFPATENNVCWRTCFSCGSKSRIPAVYCGDCGKLIGPPFHLNLELPKKEIPVLVITEKIVEIVSTEPNDKEREVVPVTTIKSPPGKGSGRITKKRHRKKRVTIMWPKSIVGMIGVFWFVAALFFFQTRGNSASLLASRQTGIFRENSMERGFKFSDVPLNHPVYMALSNLAAMDLPVANENGEFRPESPVLWEEWREVVSRLQNSFPLEGSPKVFSGREEGEMTGEEVWKVLDDLRRGWGLNGTIQLSKFAPHSTRMESFAALAFLVREKNG